jgi:hypothetical protein
MSFSEILDSTFNEALVKFLQDTNSSRASLQIVNCLRNDQTGRYAVPNRNEIVKNLAEDVETALGSSANLIFRTPGYLHDTLQTLLDEYLNWYDRILYSKQDQTSPAVLQSMVSVM